MPPRPISKSQYAEVSDELLHFTGRRGTSGPHVPQRILEMTAEDRLASIVRDGQIRAFHVFGNDALPVVCFSEASPRHASDLISVARWSPWAIGFTRLYVYDRGGGPAHYVRHDDWSSYWKRAPARQRAFGIQFSPGEAEVPAAKAGLKNWLHEREWRLPSEDAQGLRFTLMQITVLLTAKPLEEFLTKARIDGSRIRLLMSQLHREEQPQPQGYFEYRCRFIG